MKKIGIMVALLLGWGGATAWAQNTEPNEETRLQMTSLFQQNVKVGNLADAAEPWAYVYQNYPNSTQYIYVYGVKILNYQIEQAKTQAEKDALFDKLMKLYDDRITYFGNNQKYPTPYIKGQKGIDYLKYRPEDAQNEAYGWLAESIEGQGVKSSLAVIQRYFTVATQRFNKDKSFGEQYIQDFLKVNDLLEQKIGVLEGDDQAQAQALKADVENAFAQSGAADCATLDKIFGKGVDAHKNDQAWLDNAIKFFNMSKCIDSDVYAKASDYSYKIAPTAAAAKGCADIAYKNKEYAKAIKYMNDAVSLSSDNAEKAKLLYQIAQIYNAHMGDYVKAKAYATDALKYKTWGEPYMLIANLYASHGKTMFGDDAILNSTIYWVVVDKLEKAKQVDASVAAEASRQIATYKKYYPKATDVFMRPELEPGKPFQIGGWVNESVIAR